jgi:hypothetical protein
VDVFFRDAQNKKVAAHRRSALVHFLVETSDADLISNHRLILAQLKNADHIDLRGDETPLGNANLLDTHVCRNNGG